VCPAWALLGTPEELSVSEAPDDLALVLQAATAAAAAGGWSTPSGAAGPDASGVSNGIGGAGIGRSVLAGHGLGVASDASKQLDGRIAPFWALALEATGGKETGSTRGWNNADTSKSGLAKADPAHTLALYAGDGNDGSDSQPLLQESSGGGRGRGRG